MPHWRDTRNIQEGDFEVAGFLVQPQHLLIIADDDSPTKITNRQMSILQHLVKHQGQVRTLDQIIRAAAGQREVTNQSVYVPISKIRKAFNESGRSPKIIIKQGRGYLLAPPVTRLESASHTETGSDSDLYGPSPSRIPFPPKARRLWSKYRYFIAGGLLAIVALTIFQDSTCERIEEATRGRQVELLKLLISDPKKNKDHRCPLILARAYTLLAEDALERQKYEEATVWLTKALEEVSTYAPIFELLARLHSITGQDELAQEAIDKAISLVKDQKLSKPETLYIERRKAQIEDEYHREIETLRELASIDPLNPEYSHHLGWLYFAHLRDCETSLARHKKAIDYYEIKPKPSYYKYYGDALMTCGDVDKAIEVLKEYTKISGGSAESHRLLGRAYIVSGRYREARRQLEIAMAPPDSDNYETLLTWGELHLAQGQYKKAYDKFNTYRLESDARPNRLAEARWRLGFTELRLGNPSNAIKQAREALRSKLDSAPALWVLGLAELQEGREQDALEVAQKIKELRPRTAEDGNPGRSTLLGMDYYYHLEGEICQYQGELDKAAKLFRKALSLYPADRAFFATSLAQALMKKGDYKGAKEVFDDILSTNSKYGRALCGVAELHEEEGQLREAARRYEDCLTAFGRENKEEPLVDKALQQLERIRLHSIPAGDVTSL